MNFAALPRLMGVDNKTTSHNLLEDIFALEKSGKNFRADDRIHAVGIPHNELTDSVKLAVSALLEKLDDATIALEDSYQQLDEMESKVDQDTLAPVPNRRAFMRRLNWAISMLERYKQTSTVVFFDLNGFKEINDTHGHAAGDAAIIHVAEKLNNVKRESDFLARIGGDEFAIIMFHADEVSATRRAEDIAERLRTSTFTHEGIVLSVDTAVGCHAIQEGQTEEEALHAADLKMFENKNARKQRQTA